MTLNNIKLKNAECELYLIIVLDKVLKSRNKT